MRVGATVRHVTYLQQVGQLQQRRRRWLWPTIAMVVVVLVAAAAVVWALTRGPGAAVTAAPASSPVQPTTAVTAVVVDADGHHACERIAAAVAAGSLDDLAALQSIGSQAAAAIDSGLAYSGALLQESATDAITAKGTDLEAKLAAATKRQATSLHSSCKRAGY